MAYLGVGANYAACLNHARVVAYTTAAVPADVPPSVIRSASHALLKRAGLVLAGRQPGVLALEGDRLVDEARAIGLVFEAVLVSEEREHRARELEQHGLEVTRVAGSLLQKKSGLRASPGILGLCRAPHPPALDVLGAGETALALVVCGVADPGNLGALARSAEAAGASGLVCIGGGVSPWNDKALRGSMGSLLRLPVFGFDSDARARDALSRFGFRHVCARVRGGVAPEAAAWGGRVALWVGPETGREAFDAAGFECVTIPMSGGVESLNVTVAASIHLYFAGRERAGAGTGP